MPTENIQLSSDELDSEEINVPQLLQDRDILSKMEEGSSSSSDHIYVNTPKLQNIFDIRNQ